MTSRYEAWISGRPTPQGSKHAHTLRTRTGKTIAVMRESSGKHLAKWRKDIREQSAVAPNRPRIPLNTPCAIDIVFNMRRPKAHYRTGANERKLAKGAPKYPANRGRGDSSKLLRAVEDALVDAGWLEDDCILVDVRARKRYVDRYTGKEGARIVLTLAD